MEEQKNALGMLDLLTVPGFCVKENRIIKVNAAAAALLLEEGMEISSLLSSGLPEYEAFSQGCLCLPLEKDGHVWNASVTRQQDLDVFVLEPDAPQSELQALALAARELRAPLNNTMIMADKLLSQEDPEVRDQAARLNRGLYQLLRIVGNMSDAGFMPTSARHTLHNVSAVMDEIFQKAQLLTEASGLTLRYTGPEESIFCLCDPQRLERAVNNILSNAIKFTPKGGYIQASFLQSGNVLRLSIQDSGTGIGDALMRSVFYRYLRQPALEDSRYGIGLGMVLVRSVATEHGGTVLIDQPEGTGTRVTLTMAIREDAPKLSSKIIYPISGGYDSGLIEFSEVLPAAMYDGTK